MNGHLPKRQLSKSKLSNYLRAQCDRQLYLSLFSNNEPALTRAGLPVPLKTRPAVELITKAGQEFEQEQFDILILALPNNVVKDAGYTTADLPKALLSGPKPAFILQPLFEPEDFRLIVLGNLGLTAHEIATIPPMSGLKPDLLYIYTAVPDEHEILPSGKRQIIAAGEQRHAISVIDMKNVTEANASYAAEVCLYAVFLSNWLLVNGLNDRFYVSDSIYLWKHVEMPAFTAVRPTAAGALAAARIEALLEDLQEGLVDPLVYMPSVIKFFKEDIPRVINIGDNQGWDKVSYHVSPRCNACDWLGNQDWLYGAAKAIYDAHPEHYCLHNAEIDDHLSKLHQISKGASTLLSGDGRTKVADLVGISASDPALKRHALLKKNRSQIGAKATALQTGNLTLNASMKLSGLASNLNAEFDIVVNFDAGAGFLTGIALKGVLFAPFNQEIQLPDGSTTRFVNLGEEAFVNLKDNLASEWVTLQNFITKLAAMASHAQQLFRNSQLGSVGTQVCFWEARQYQELCNAFGRHLLKMLELPDRDAKALAWLFPAEELMERDEELAPGIVFIKDAVELATHLPVSFTHTLLGTVKAYHHSNMAPRPIDKYYQEPLSSAIPRERIFEIWKSSTGTVRSYGRDISILDAAQKYGAVLKAHAWALASVTARLRTDFRGALKGKAPALRLTVPTGASGVAYDSRLWLQWNTVESSSGETARKTDLVASGESLEAAYKAVVLTRFLRDLGNDEYEYEVSEDSTEAKLEESGKYFVLGLMDEPGYPLRSAANIGVTAARGIEEYMLFLPLYKIINVTLISFDRVNRRAVVEFRASWDPYEPMFRQIVDNDLIPLQTQPIFIMDGLPPAMKYTDTILKAIGNPSCANVAPEALLAMGSAKARKQKGTDANSPAAKVLWEADKLANSVARTAQEAKALADFAKTSNAHDLNGSQYQAVLSCAAKNLAVIWGPPGTGKTDTLTALLHAVVKEGQTSDRSRKILITGPNYRAVEELADRLLENLDADPSCAARMFWAYSKSREVREPRAVQAHLQAVGVKLDLRNRSAELDDLNDSLIDPSEVTIVATTAHAIHSIAALISGSDANLIQDIFDLVVIDESSQVPVTLAVSAFAVMKDDAQLVIAGDHLQMPPISQLEPPKNAEYLVGSIQTYLLKRFRKIKTDDLLINYRSNQDLVDYAKTIGYPQQLVAFAPDRRLEMINVPAQVIATLPSGLPITDAYKELLLPDRKVSALIHDDIVSSQANELEAKLVAGLAYALRQCAAKELAPQPPGAVFTPFTDEEFFTFGLGVVTPHKAQKALVIKELINLFPAASPETIFDAVDTVERFQGGERHTIIVSFGVGDLDIIEGEEAFLMQLERTNVAVSRAKAKCIVLMPKALAYYLPTEAKVAVTSVAIKSYIEEFCANRLPVTITDSNGIVKSGEVRWH